MLSRPGGLCKNTLIFVKSAQVIVVLGKEEFLRYCFWSSESYRMQPTINVKESIRCLIDSFFCPNLHF
jgi:hypothetical protein